MRKSRFEREAWASFNMDDLDRRISKLRHAAAKSLRAQARGGNFGRRPELPKKLLKLATMLSAGSLNQALSFGGAYAFGSENAAYLQLCRVWRKYQNSLRKGAFKKAVSSYEWGTPAERAWARKNTDWSGKGPIRSSKKKQAALGRKYKFVRSKGPRMPKALGKKRYDYWEQRYYTMRGGKRVYGKHAAAPKGSHTYAAKGRWKKPVPVRGQKTRSVETIRRIVRRFDGGDGIGSPGEAFNAGAINAAEHKLFLRVVIGT